MTPREHMEPETGGKAASRAGRHTAIGPHDDGSAGDSELTIVHCNVNIAGGH